MKALNDPQQLLADGLRAIRAQFRVPDSFPPDVLAAAEAAASRPLTDHVDRTDAPFVTLDPATSTDLDQAFAIEAAGGDGAHSDLILHYAIADVPWFVRDGDPLDREAWKRGATTYLPDGKAGLYPAMISEGAASLLPDGPRPAIVLSVRVAEDGAVRLDAAQRAVIRSRAKLAYDTVRDEDLPPYFGELARRIAAAEAQRGAARVDPPEQEVTLSAAGVYDLRFRPPLVSEQRNAALSLAANMAVADALYAAETGLFRVMAGPDARAVERLRRTAAAFQLDWPTEMPLTAFERRLDPARPTDAAFMMAIRRAGDGASYQPWRAGERPWHAAMAATYAHCTAPLRRLADRYVLDAALAIANGQRVSAETAQAFERLPDAMAKADARDGQIYRAVIDLAEVALMSSRVGETFPALVTDVDESAARFQLVELPIVAKIKTTDVLPGARIAVRLIEADPERRRLEFERAD